MLDLDNLIKNIDTLPPLSDTTFEIQEIYSYENINISKLVQVIESDVSLAINILKMVNAPLYGFSRKISSLKQAVSLFGTQKIYGLVLDYSINQKLIANTRIYGFSNDDFNDMCHLQSSLMLQWYSTIDSEIAKFLAPLALIMESGKLVMANEIMKNSLAKDYRNMLNECESVEECEHELVGTTSYYISGVLFEYWKLDSLYAEILKGLDFAEHSSDEVDKYVHILDVIRVAINLKGVLTQDSIYQASGLVQDLGLDEKEFIKIALKVKEQYEESKQ